MNAAQKITGTEEAWESGELGASVQHAAVAPKEAQDAVDQALGMQMVSIRLPKALIEEFRALAKVHRMGYQPLMREALKRFAEGEMKRLVIQYGDVIEREVSQQKETHVDERAAA
ncbi:hypothetical protein [Ralstonia wenshanensis]|uniref:Uncharacterized protein n=1 Tax=Ralstonia wenshanensis TaxID=2842456 RepID=A0AAD2EP95_9RALS|nr:hypothetical protein [Ralstonia wenshanensis]CAJ0699309.1 hypothetical protein LMG18091_02901 [Ralstonia wenshanensis]